MTLIIGPKALGSACRTNSRRRGTPLRIAISIAGLDSTFSTAERAHDELSRVPSSVPTVGSVLAHTIPEGHSGMCSYSSHYGPSHDAVPSFISSDPSGVFDVSTYWDDESTESIVATSRDPALKWWSDH